MGIFLRKLWQNKPKQWGPFSAVQSALFHNLESMGIDPQDKTVAIPLWEMAGFFGRDIFGTEISSGYNSSGDPEWVGNTSYFYQTGHGGLCDSVEIKYGNFKTNYSKGSLLFRFKITGQAYPGLGHYILCAPDQGDFNSGIILIYNDGTATFRIRDTAGYYALTSFTYTLNSWINLFVTWDLSSPFNLYAYVNGKYTGDATGNGMRASGIYPDGLLIGAKANYSSVPYYGFRGNVDTFLLSSNYTENKELTAIQHSDNPYQLWQPVPQKTIFLPIGGGSTLLPIMMNMNQFNGGIYETD